MFSTFLASIAPAATGANNTFASPSGISLSLIASSLKSSATLSVLSTVALSLSVRVLLLFGVLEPSSMSASPFLPPNVELSSSLLDTISSS